MFQRVSNSSIENSTCVTNHKFVSESNVTCFCVLEPVVFSLPLKPICRWILISFFFSNSLVDDYDAAEDFGVQDAELEMVRSCLNLSKDAVAMDVSLLPCHLIGRFLNMETGGHKYIEQLLNQARRPNFDCLIPAKGGYRIRFLIYACVCSWPEVTTGHLSLSYTYMIFP